MGCHVHNDFSSSISIYVQRCTGLAVTGSSYNGPKPLGICNGSADPYNNRDDKRLLLFANVGRSWITLILPDVSLIG